MRVVAHRARVGSRTDSGAVAYHKDHTPSNRFQRVENAERKGRLARAKRRVQKKATHDEEATKDKGAREEGPMKQSWEDIRTDALDLPPPNDLGPRVEHIVLQEHIWDDQPISNVLLGLFNVPKEICSKLIYLGAIYYSHIPPILNRPTVEGSHQCFNDKIKQFREQIIEDQNIRDPVSLGKCQRIEDDIKVHYGGYIRVHLHPKRFPRCYDVDWASTVIYENKDAVIISKPWGVNVPPTVDNRIECCEWMLSSALQVPVFLTHRLDVGTSGVLVMAKSKAFCTHFNGLLSSKGNVRKFYKVLTKATMRLGIVTHYAKIGQQKKGFPRRTVIFDKEEPDTVSCVLRVESCERLVDVAKNVAGAKAGQGEAEDELFFESTVELFTGRTHQIRAQFAACGCPVFNDHIYTSSEEGVSSTERIGLHSSRIVFTEKSPFLPEYEYRAGPPWWSL